jgi:hypothetical protein
MAVDATAEPAMLCHVPIESRPKVNRIEELRGVPERDYPRPSCRGNRLALELPEVEQFRLLGM